MLPRQGGLEAGRRSLVATAVVAAFLGSLLLLGAAAADSTRLSPTTRLAWFYSRPLDGTTAATLVARDAVMILSGSDYEVGFLARVRSAGWRSPILEYIDTAYAMGPASAADGSCPAGFDGMTIQPAWNLNTFCNPVNPHEDWFLHNGAGKRLYSSIDSSSSYYLMNPASPGWRAFVAAQVKDALFGTNGRPPLYHMDGLFLDDVWGTANAPRSHEDDSDGTCRECGTDAQWLSGYVGFLQAVKAAAGKRPVWINSDNSTTLTRPVDGLMIENMGASWGTSYMSQSEIERRWHDVDALAAAHKSALLVGQGDARSDVERMRFAARRLPDGRRAAGLLPVPERRRLPLLLGLPRIPSCARRAGRPSLSGRPVDLAA